MHIIDDADGEAEGGAQIDKRITTTSTTTGYKGAKIIAKDICTIRAPVEVSEKTITTTTTTENTGPISVTTTKERVEVQVLGCVRSELIDEPEISKCVLKLPTVVSEQTTTTFTTNTATTIESEGEHLEVQKIEKVESEQASAQ